MGAGEGRGKAAERATGGRHRSSRVTIRGVGGGVDDTSCHRAHLSDWLLGALVGTEGTIATACDIAGPCAQRSYLGHNERSCFLLAISLSGSPDRFSPPPYPPTLLPFPPPPRPTHPLFFVCMGVSASARVGVRVCL